MSPAVKSSVYQKDAQLKSIANKDPKEKSKPNKGSSSDSSGIELRKENEGCPHTLVRRVFARKMCVSCYYQREGKKNAWECEHKTKKHYSKGMCQNCYLANYYRERKIKASLKPKP
jgi:hypothetical protein